MQFLYGNELDLDSTDIFFMMNEHSYAAFLGVLSTIYMKAHASSNLRKLPYNAAIIISQTMMFPYKDQPESSLDRLAFLVDKMKEPDGGINMGIFHSDDHKFNVEAKVGLKHSTSQCWPLISEYKSEEITVNLPPKQLSTGENIFRYFQKIQIENALDVDLKYIDYNMKISDVFSLLENSKIHISYQGGTSWLSVAMDIPTIIIHNVPEINRKLHLKFKLFGQELGNVNILVDNKIKLVRVHPMEHHITINQLQEKIRDIKNDHT